MPLLRQRSTDGGASAHPLVGLALLAVPRLLAGHTAIAGLLDSSPLDTLLCWRDREPLGDREARSESTRTLKRDRETVIDEPRCAVGPVDQCPD